MSRVTQYGGVTESQIVSGSGIPGHLSFKGLEDLLCLHSGSLVDLLAVKSCKTPLRHEPHFKGKFLDFQRRALYGPIPVKTETFREL